MIDTPPIKFYTRLGCHLCEDALTALKPIAEDARIAVSEIDIDLDLDLLSRYDHRVPVIEYAGVVLAEGRIERADLLCVVDRISKG